MPQTDLNGLLQQTSRSFYLTLRVLPGAVRPQIGLAYLLARTTDTIADTEILPVAQRLAALQRLRERILGTNSSGLNFGELARHQDLPAEQVLLEKVEASLTALQALTPEDLKLVRQVLDTITSGQELDLKRFQTVSQSTSALTPALSPRERDVADTLANPTPPDSSQSGNEKLPLRGERAGMRAEQPSKIIALQNDTELDDYTYRVAGCVGEFWTKMCRTHLFPAAKLEEAKFLADGVRYGKGLQLVNILRDLPADLRKGRCYLPADRLAEAGLQPADLLSPASENKFRPLYDHYLGWAESHLTAGWNYTSTIPRRQMRVRLACAWPILIGWETLQRLRGESILDPACRIKISRRDVRRIVVRSLLCYPRSSAWERLFPGTVSQ